MDDDDIENESDEAEGPILVQRALLALYLVMWSLHWSAKGDPSYGDHLLWDRAQKRIRKDVDRVAELVASIYESDVLDPLASMPDIHETLTVEHPDQSAPVRALAVLDYVSSLVVLVHDNLSDNELTDEQQLAAENVLAGVADHLNELAYLIQQRLGGPEAAEAMRDRFNASDD